MHTHSHTAQVVTSLCVNVKNLVSQTSIPVPAPGAGVIEELLVEDGSKVVAGQELFKLRLTEGGLR